MYHLTIEGCDDFNCRKPIDQNVMNKPWNVTHHSGKIDRANRVITVEHSKDGRAKPVYWVAPNEYLNEGVRISCFKTFPKLARKIMPDKVLIYCYFVCTFTKNVKCNTNVNLVKCNNVNTNFRGQIL